MGRKVIPMEPGSRYGKWTIIEYSHKSPVSRNAYYKARCDCGRVCAVNGSRMRKGKSEQCKSCAAKENGRKGLYGMNEGKNLYMVRCNEYVKIGVSENVSRRMIDLQSSNPYELELIYEGKGEGILEEAWHTKYANSHHRGEWFYIPDTREG